MSWQWLSVITMVLWGSWGVLHKIATRRLSPDVAWIFQGAGNLLALLSFALILIARGSLEVRDWRASGLALLAGILGALGTVAFLFAISKGKASVVVTLTALYPVVTIALSYFLLGETLSLRQLLGVLLALIAMILIAVE